MRKLMPVVLLAAALAAIAVVGAASSGAGAVADGKLKGKVTDATSGAPIQSACVVASDVDGNWTQTQTGADGKYQMNLAPGPYQVFFSDCSGSPNMYVPIVYKKHVGLDSDPTDPVTITSGQNSAANGALPRGGSIAVHAQDETGDPLPNVLACPLYVDDNAQNGFCGVTDEFGDLTITGVPVGLNRLSSYAFDLGQGFVYDQKPVFWLGDKITVTQGQTTGPLTLLYTNGLHGSSSVSGAGHIVRSGHKISVTR